MISVLCPQEIPSSGWESPEKYEDQPGRGVRIGHAALVLDGVTTLTPSCSAWVGSATNFPNVSIGI